MSRPKRWCWILLALTLVFIAAAVVTGKVQSMTLNTGALESFNEGWTLTHEDGTVEMMERLPLAGRGKPGENIVLKNHLPERYVGKTLRFVAENEIVKVYVNDRLVYHFGDEDQYVFGQTPGGIVVFADIPEKLREKQIRIEFFPRARNYGVSINAIAVGERDALILDFLTDNIWALAFAVLVMVSGLILVVLGFFRRRIMHKSEGIFYLAIYFVMSGICFLLESKVLMVFYGNQYLWSVIIFPLLMSQMLFVDIYFAEIMPEGKRVFKILGYVLVTNFLVQLLLECTNTLDFLSMILVTQILVLAVMGTGMFMCIKRIVHSRRSESPLRLLGMIGMMTAVIIDFFRLQVLGDVDPSLFSRAGILFFAVCSMLLFMKDMINEQSMRSKKAVDDAEAAERAKSDFLANMSHEIRTPINSILGMNALLKQSCVDEKQGAYIEGIENSAKTLMAQVNEILEVSRLDSRQVDFKDVTRRFQEYEDQLPVQFIHFQAPNARVLAVDDVSMNLKVLTEMLKETRMQIDLAKSGREALGLIRNNFYDLIYMDLTMPEMDGIEVLGHIRGERNPNRQTPVIVVTANEKQKAKRACMEAGFDGFMTKPLRREQLLMVTAKYIPDELMIRKLPELGGEKLSLSEKREQNRQIALQESRKEDNYGEMDAEEKNHSSGKKKKNFIAGLLFILAGVVIDILGRRFTDILQLPVWLDCLGTVIVAIHLGPAAAAAAGLMASIGIGIMHPSAWAYILVNSAVGVVVGIFYPKGRADGLLRVITGLIAAITAAVIAIPINIYLYNALTGNIWGDAMYNMFIDRGYGRLFSAIVAELFVELPDKLICVLAASGALQLLRKISDERGGDRLWKKKN